MRSIIHTTAAFGLGALAAAGWLIAAAVAQDAPAGGARAAVEQPAKAKGKPKPKNAEPDEFAPDVRPAAPEKTPPPLTRYQGREIAQTMHFQGAPWLTRESRQREEDCERMLAALKVQPGQTICDLGCGNGFYTLPLAKKVGAEGLVYGVDVQREMLLMTKERAAAEKIKNIRLVHGSYIDPFLPEGKVDLVLLVDVYHEFSHPVQMLAAIRKSLSPQGRLVLVEFRGEDPNVPIKALHKMTKKQVRKELEPNGYELAEEYDELPWQHMMFFRKKATEDDAAAPPAKSDAK